MHSSKVVDLEPSLSDSCSLDHESSDMCSDSAAPGPFKTMEVLGLDPPALQKAGIQPHLINRLYRALHANASAFSRIVLAEQERLAAMAKGAPCVPMSDRLLAYIMGVQAPLTVYLQDLAFMSLLIKLDPPGG
jgi:hypothetical protein